VHEIIKKNIQKEREKYQRIPDLSQRRKKYRRAQLEIELNEKRNFTFFFFLFWEEEGVSHAMY
jgi:hypothetical protein